MTLFAFKLGFVISWGHESRLGTLHQWSSLNLVSWRNSLSVRLEVPGRVCNVPRSDLWHTEFVLVMALFPCQ